MLEKFSRKNSEKELADQIEKLKREKMSQNLVKKQIQTTVEYLSQNGYISFANFLQVLYLLQITN
jgi:hypothetical protein